MGANEFETAVQRLITQVGHWEASRWNAPAAAGDTTRAEAVRKLVQQLADAAADAEQRRRRPIPRLADTVLPDQLRVMADDLLIAEPPDDVLSSATEAVSRTRTQL
ncbi:hypothetical protein GCM10020358_10740 [Amorphoplanes nipponensis]|uniref:Uncharacterized protein n=1 Tax=Actinoplanes nipponensis TaxID=135950 RepID=A0A919MPP3_9ACTN|nr:hypothetical protein [Actinoplanes nipponensis]GIE52282.1 hypothetical protein Ani05nite_58160 [Actinoplanes nipponensis]